MSSLFDNAVASIRMGVEDFQRNDADRSLSAVRNLYSGTLLLAKEVLVRKAPKAAIKDVLASGFEVVPDGNGGVTHKPFRNTVDFNSLADRLKAFGVLINSQKLNDALKSLNRIRNDIEHLYTPEPHAVVREAIARSFPAISALFRAANEDPSACLGDVWTVMLETKEFYDVERDRCRRTFDKIKWISPTVAKSYFKCPHCDSELVEQKNYENQDQYEVVAKCNNCLEETESEDLLLLLLEGGFGYQGNFYVSDLGEEGPIVECPDCSKTAFIGFEEQCAWCGAEYSAQDCAVCHNSMDWDWIFYGDGNGLCSYHSHVMSKND